MGRLSDAVLSTAVAKGPKCSVGVFIEQMREDDPEVIEDLDELLRAPPKDVPATLICDNLSRLFTANIHPDVMRRHRRRVVSAPSGDRCACKVECA